MASSYQKLRSRYDWDSPVPPPGYVPGKGRGAVAFVTNAELATLASTSPKTKKGGPDLFDRQNEAIDAAFQKNKKPGTSQSGGAEKPRGGGLFDDVVAAAGALDNKQVGTLFGVAGAPVVGPGSSGNQGGNNNAGAGAKKLDIFKAKLNEAATAALGKKLPDAEDDAVPQSAAAPRTTEETVSQAFDETSAVVNSALVTEEILILLEERTDDHPEDPLNWVRLARAHAAKDYKKKAIEILRKGAEKTAAGKKSDAVWIELLRQMEACKYPSGEIRKVAELSVAHFTESEELWERCAEAQVLEDSKADFYWRGTDALVHSESLWLHVLSVTPDEEREGGGTLHKEIIQTALEGCPSGMPKLWLKLAEFSSTAQEGVDTLRSAVRVNPHSLLLWKQFAFFMEKNPAKEEIKLGKEERALKLVNELVLIVKAASNKMMTQNSDGGKVNKGEAAPLGPRVTPPMSQEDVKNCWLSELGDLVEVSEAVTKAILVHFFASAPSSSRQHRGEPSLAQDAKREADRAKVGWRQEMLEATGQHFDRTMTKHSRLMKVLFEVAYLDADRTDLDSSTLSPEQVPAPSELHLALKAFHELGGVEGLKNLFDRQLKRGIFAPSEETRGTQSPGVTLALQTVGFLTKTEIAALTERAASPESAPLAITAAKALLDGPYVLVGSHPRAVLWYVLATICHRLGLVGGSKSPIAVLQAALSEAQIKLDSPLKADEDDDSPPPSPPASYALVVELYLRLRWVDSISSRAPSTVFQEVLQATRQFPQNAELWILALKMGAAELQASTHSALADENKELYLTALQQNPGSEKLWATATQIHLHQYGEGQTATSILQEGMHLHPASPLLWRTRTEVEWHLHTGSEALAAAGEGVRRCGITSQSDDLLAATIDFEPPLRRPKKARTLMQTPLVAKGASKPIIAPAFLHSKRVPVLLAVSRIYLLGGMLDRVDVETNKALLLAHNKSGDAFCLQLIRAILLDLGAPLNSKEDKERKRAQGASFDLRGALRQIPVSALSAPGVHTQQMLSKLIQVTSSLDYYWDVDIAKKALTSHCEVAALIDVTGSGLLQGYYWGRVRQATSCAPPSVGLEDGSVGKFAACLQQPQQQHQVIANFVVGMPNSANPRTLSNWWMYNLLEVARLMLADVGVTLGVKQ